MTPREEESLAWSLGFAARRLGGALDLAAPGGWIGSHVLRGVWRAACRELHYLEMMVRRLLVAMAGELELSVSRKVPNACAGVCGDTSDALRNRGKSTFFLVFDRKLGPAAVQARLAAIGIWEGDVSAALPKCVFGTPPEPEPVVDAAHLAARFAALASVLADPEAHARRMALKMSRGGDPIRLGARPALARGGTLDLTTSAFVEAERLALKVLNRRRPVIDEAFWYDENEPPNPVGTDTATPCWHHPPWPGQPGVARSENRLKRPLAE